MRKSFIVVFVSVFIPLTFLHAQKIDTAFFRQKEAGLTELYQRIFETENTKTRNSYERDFLDSFKEILKLDNAFYFPFDSLKNIGRIQSDDDKLVVYTWNIPQKGGFHNYYCLLHYCIKKSKEYKIVSLNESASFYNVNRQDFADKNRWPGALYYEVITQKYKGEISYTLLGFNFNDLFTNLKLIELITFDENNDPVFPGQRFLYEGKYLNRIVFEYAERAQMTLNYNATTKKIIADHLSPIRESLEGQHQFYGPDFSYDSFEFTDGIWKYKSDIHPEN